MIRTLALTKEMKPVWDLALNELNDENILWYWVDFNMPNEEEIQLLDKHFHFHHLAIEDCVHSLNSPKLDFYEDYNFLVLNSLNQENMEIQEVTLFLAKNYVVSYHSEESIEINEALNRVKLTAKNWDKGPVHIAHQIIDKIVDHYFPAVYKIDDSLNRIDTNASGRPTHELVDEVFAIRKELLRLRRVINGMRDLLYRILNSERLQGFEEHILYFSDIHDHLLKLSIMVESSREMTADMRDSYLSINSAHMNKNMMVLTVISSIFIPLTFIVGVYGMNFAHMPELNWKYGYFLILAIMFSLGIGMFVWFKRKGWLDI